MLEQSSLLVRPGALQREPSQVVQENGVRIRTVCRHLGVFWLVLGGGTLPAQFIDKGTDAEVLPQVPAGFQVTVFAREPLVRQPCSMAFDVRGRLFVGMGPQYRNPTPETPGDSVVIVTDADGDGVAETAKVFATGFNAVQGLAWRGRDLWVANAPDLTIVRDLDGDDEADEYVRVYTDLGNLEHGLHGLNWAPDGKLYMSKGNSKGLNRPGRYAPKGSTGMPTTTQRMTGACLAECYVVMTGAATCRSFREGTATPGILRLTVVSIGWGPTTIRRKVIECLCHFLVHTLDGITPGMHSGLMR